MSKAAASKPRLTKAILLTDKVPARIPGVPNFIRTGWGLLQLEDLTEDTLRKIGEQWTENLIARAAQQRELSDQRRGTK